jgi:hypothetical protein
VALTDFAEMRWYADKAAAFYEFLPQLNKYKSCGIWIEAVTEDTKLGIKEGTLFAEVTAVTKLGNRQVRITVVRKVDLPQTLVGCFFFFFLKGPPRLRIG